MRKIEMTPIPAMSSRFLHLKQPYRNISQKAAHAPQVGMPLLLRPQQLDLFKDESLVPHEKYSAAADATDLCSGFDFEDTVKKYLLAKKQLRSLAVTSRSFDSGIDGSGRLLDGWQICFQAKKTKCATGRPDLQAFAGALLGQNCQLGYFVSTGGFTKTALAYVRGLKGLNIQLIQGSDVIAWIAQQSPCQAGEVS